MVGFCNGLGIVIGLAQFNILKVLVAMQDDDAAERRLGGSAIHSGGAFAPLQRDSRGWKLAILWMIFYSVLTIATYVLTTKFTKAIPGSLV